MRLIYWMLSLALLSTSVQAAEVALPINEGLTSIGTGAIGAEVGMYVLGANATLAGAPIAPVRLFVQQSANFRTTVQSRFPATVPVVSNSTVQAFKTSASSPTTYPPSGQYVANNPYANVFGANVLSSYPTPDVWFANERQSNIDSGMSAKPVYSSTLADLKIQHKAAYDRYFPSQGPATVNDICVPALEPGCRAATGIDAGQAPDYLYDTLNLTYHAMLVMHKNQSNGSWGGYVYVWSYANACNDGSAPNSSNVCSGPAGTLPILFKDAALGWAGAGVSNYETTYPKSTFPEYALLVETGIYKYAVQQSLCPSITNPTQAQVDSCVSSAYNVKPSTSWTYSASTGQACIVTGTFSFNQCAQLTTAPLDATICPAGYSVASPFLCQLQDASLVITEPGWGCRVYRTNNTYSLEMRDPDCAYAKNSLSGATGSLEVAYGSTVAKITSTNAYVDNATQVSYPASTKVTYAYPYARGQVITDTIIVSNDTNKVLSYNNTNIFAPPPTVTGALGSGLGADGGTVGGVTIGGGTVLPGYGCTSNCTATPTNSPYGSNPTGSTASPGSSIVKADPSQPPSSPTTDKVAPDGLPEALKGIGTTQGLELVQTCPPDAFKFHVGNFLGRDFTLWDQGVFCSVLTPYQSLVRTVSTALVWFGALFVVISA